MIAKIKNKIIFIFLKIFIKLKIVRSFSQEGEDIIVERIFKSLKIKYNEIFYLDIGAGHPIRYSNTLLFYVKGSQGVNVDPNIKNIELYKYLRPKDISCDMLLGDSTNPVDFYVYEQPELNTTNIDKVKKLKLHNIFHLEKKKLIKKNINQFFNEILKNKISSINFFNLDVEGSELELIKSINWKLFKPKIISIEIPFDNIDSIYENEICRILFNNNYKIFSKLYNSLIFIRKNYEESK